MTFSEVKNNKKTLKSQVLLLKLTFLHLLKLKQLLVIISALHHVNVMKYKCNKRRVSASQTAISAEVENSFIHVLC